MITNWQQNKSVLKKKKKKKDLCFYRQQGSWTEPFYWTTWQCHYQEKVEVGSVSWFRQWCLHTVLMTTRSAIKRMSWIFSLQRNWISPLLVHSVSYKPGRMSLYLTQQSGCFCSSSLQGRYCTQTSCIPTHSCRATEIVGLATEPQIDGRPLYNVDNSVWLRLEPWISHIIYLRNYLDRL